MIVRNEEFNIEDCMRELYFADEIIVVDTGSTDCTYAYLENGWKFGDITDDGVISNPKLTVYKFPWTDSFADARNFALSKCTGDWVLWIDADDRVTPEGAVLIRAAMDNPGPRTQAKTVHFGFRLRDDGPDGFNFAEGQPRLFPRVPGLEWEGRVHESYMPSAAKLGIEKVDTDIIIDHTGYKDPAVMLKKHARNLRLIKMEEDSPKKFYHMGKNLMALGHYIEAENCFQEVLERRWAASLEEPFRDQVRHCMASLIIGFKGADKSVDQYLENNSKPDSLFLRAEVALKRGQVKEAEAMYKEYLNLGPIQDPHGSQQAFLSGVCQSRLNTITKVREAVLAG
jgi:hypothetical protein